VGAINGRDGRRFRLSRPAALVEAFRRDPRPLPVDYEHASAASRTTGAPAPAAGWITDLKVAENAIWGLIEWNEKARAMVAAREYRFLSPEFLYDPASGEVRALLSAGLVHRPNLDALTPGLSCGPGVADLLSRFHRVSGQQLIAAPQFQHRGGAEHAIAHRHRLPDRQRQSRGGRGHLHRDPSVVPPQTQPPGQHDGEKQYRNGNRN